MISLLVLAAATFAAAADPAPPNQLTAAEKKAGWRLLFDGKTTAGWRGYKSQEMPAGWKVVDGALTKDGTTADIIIKDQFGDFDLQFEWKIAPGGNAGIFYRGTEEYDHVYWSAPEYQLLDDAAAKDGQSRLTAAGSAYALYPAPAGVVKPAGEWNQGRILVQGAHVEHWLNGKRVLQYELDSPELKAAVAKSKFKDIARFGKPQKGHILIQDHGNAVWYRNVRIKPLT